MMNFRAISCVAVFCAVGVSVAALGEPAFAEDALPAQCLQFTCKESIKHCNSGGAMSTVTVDANTAVQGCPSSVTVIYDSNRTATTPFPYYSCGCRPPDVAKITK